MEVRYVNAKSDVRPPIVVIVGPTAVGKTALAVDLALRFSGEIVTADSMQVYRGMNIGTAKPTPSEQRGVPHHLIDICDPDRLFNVAEYRDLAHRAIADIHARGRLPLVAGGTGLYIKAILDEFLFPDEGPDYEIRGELESYSRVHGSAALHARLADIDPTTAERVHPNDIRRVVRALEVYQRTGRPMSEHLKEIENSVSRYRVVQIGLTRPRASLYQRIEARVDEQIEAGLVDEVKGLIQRFPDMPVARQALGYKEIIAYLEGEVGLDEAIALLKRDTRRFAKRQFTWFNRDQRIHWIDLETHTAGSLEPAAHIETLIRRHIDS